MTALKPKPSDEHDRFENALLLLEAVHRCRALGWRTVTVDRLVRIANGDDPKAMPPDPTTAPKSKRGTHFR